MIGSALLNLVLMSIAVGSVGLAYRIGLGLTNSPDARSVDSSLDALLQGAASINRTFTEHER